MNEALIKSTIAFAESVGREVDLAEDDLDVGEIDAGEIDAGESISGVAESNRPDSLVGRSRASLRKNFDQLSDKIADLHKDIASAVRDRDNEVAIVEAKYQKRVASIEADLWQHKTVRSAIELALATLPDE